ncbi:hypothetical protein [Vagococcus fluvialis]|uniref:hypothetical protein n=1 Tax=Vagococcus fluvialis TaxID=2738 RepID=UPI003B220A0A
MDNNNLEYSIRWIFHEHSKHDINAQTLNKSESAFIEFLMAVSRENNIQLEVEVSARKQGSFESQYIIKIWDTFNSIPIEIKQIVIVYFINLFFTPSTKSDDREYVKLLSDITKDINDRKMSIHQANLLVNASKIPRKYKNAFFKANIKDTSIKSLEVKKDKQKLKIINHEEFDGYIEGEKIEEELNVKVKVYIVSPVIVKGSREKWSGKFNDNQIRFDISDINFLSKAQNNQISFNTGFYIMCDILKKTITGASNERVVWEVKKIYEYGSEETRIINKKINNSRELNKQLSLFDDNN